MGENLYCKIFVESLLERESLIAWLQRTLGGSVERRTIRTAELELDVSENDEHGTHPADPRDAFLYWPFILDVEPASTMSSRAGYVESVADLLRTLWDRGRAVAACDFEHELPHNGGIGFTPARLHLTERAANVIAEVFAALQLRGRQIRVLQAKAATQDERKSLADDEGELIHALQFMKTRAEIAELDVALLGMHAFDGWRDARSIASAFDAAAPRSWTVADADRECFLDPITYLEMVHVAFREFASGGKHVFEDAAALVAEAAKRLRE